MKSLTGIHQKKKAKCANRNKIQCQPFINESDQTVLVLTACPFLLALLAFFFFGDVFLLNRMYAFLVLLTFRTVSLWSMWCFRSFATEAFSVHSDHQEGLKV